MRGQRIDRLVLECRGGQTCCSILSWWDHRADRLCSPPSGEYGSGEGLVLSQISELLRLVDKSHNLVWWFYWKCWCQQERSQVRSLKNIDAECCRHRQNYLIWRQLGSQRLQIQWMGKREDCLDLCRKFWTILLHMLSSVYYQGGWIGLGHSWCI